MESKTNWAKISALAAVGGVVVAFLAYAAPHPQPTPLSASAPGLTTVPAPPPEQDTMTSAFAPGQMFTTSQSPPSVAPLPPAGCTRAVPVVQTYYQTAGSTRYTREAAARQAAQDLFSVTIGLDSSAFADISALYNDFARMQLILEATGEGDSYSATQQQTNADAQTLYRICGVS